jgi:glycosyltransferase involved in cell wall biosynthesis
VSRDHGTPRPLAFVAPRFGPGVVGGSEAVMREIALGLAARGHQVEVVTTCATDHYTWANALPPGTTVEEGVTVHRFETVPSATRVGHRAHMDIYHDRPTTLDEQIGWLSFPFRVPRLYTHLLRHGGRYGAVVFSPYLFWTTTVCMPVVAERAVVVPCLHDEVYARLEAIRPVLRDPARVWFLSEPEHALAHRLGPVAPAHSVTGAGVDVPSSYDPEGFRRTHGIERPFVLYAGRREVDKGWDWLLEAYRSSLDVDDSGFDLVAVGVGEVEVPRSLRHRVIDLGFLSASERDDAMAAATAYLQPSLMESFSRSIMEAWLAGTVVLARQGSEVVAWHCERSGGGGTFADGKTLAARLRGLADDPGSATAMAERGRRYVLDTYTWPVVLDRMEADLRSLTDT